MLTWYKQTYEATAADAAAAIITRLWTPDGIIHDPGSTGKLSQREDWAVHQMQVYVTKTTTGYLKAGLVGQLVVALDYPGAWFPVVAPHHGCLMQNHGLIYRGGPFRATHGVGWAFYKGALADTDKIIMRILYEPIARGPL